MLDPDSLLLSPRQQRAADVLRAVIATDRPWLATPIDDLLQRPDYPSAGQRQVDLDPQSFAAEVVQDVEQPEAMSVAELVVHEVHRPDLVDGLGHRQWLGPLAHQPLLRFDPQVQFELPVNPINPLVVPAEAFDIAQVQKAQAKAPVAIGRVKRPR